MEDRPTAEELLDTVATLLQDEVLPAVDGPLQHKVRVAANLCRIVERELRLGPEAARRERKALARLVGADDSLEALNARLSDALLGADDEFLARSVGVLHEAVVAKLEIDKPGYARPATA